MSEKRMLLIDPEVAERIDKNRGDMNQSDFINFLINSCLKEDPGKQSYISEEDFKEEFKEFQQGIRELLRNFLEFFISYGLELGKQPEDKAFEELSLKLQDFANSASKTKNS